MNEEAGCAVGAIFQILYESRRGIVTALEFFLRSELFHHSSAQMDSVIRILVQDHSS